MATPLGCVPIAKSTFAEKEVASIVAQLGKVSINGYAEYPVNPVLISVTEIYW